VSLRRHNNSALTTGNRVRRSMSSSDSRRQEVTEQIVMRAEDCSKSVQRRLEKLGRRKLRVGYGDRQFMRRSGTQTPSKLRLCWMVDGTNQKRVCDFLLVFHCNYRMYRSHIFCGCWDITIYWCENLQFFAVLTHHSLVWSQRKGVPV